MKICMLSSGHGPLDDRIFYKEVLTLARTYPHINIITPGEQSGFNCNYPGITYYPLKKTSSLFSRFMIIPRACHVVIKSRPDVCHFHDYELIFAAPIIRLFSKCKIIYDVHEAYPEMAEASRKIPKALKPFIVKFVYYSQKIISYFIDCIIAADNSIAQQFSHKHCVETIFNYPRLSIFSTDQKRLNDLTEQYKGRIPIIYQGSISEERGLFKMIDAMTILKNKKPEIILLLVGDMSIDLQIKISKTLKEKDLVDSIDIVGWVSHNDVVNYICISKIGLVPLLPTNKFMKNIPIKQFEYMACGVPVLGADLPPISSYINKSGCGKVYDSTSVESLASGILQMLESEEEWRRMSVSGKKAVQDLWNWGKMEGRLLAIYDDLLSAS